MSLTPVTPAQPDSAARGRAVWIGVGLVLLVFLVFGRVISHPFLNWDDDIQIVNNPDLNPVTWQGLWWNFSHTRMTVYMPVSYAVWSAVAWVSPKDAGGALNAAWFHGLNVSLHATATVLVFVLLRQLVRLTVNGSNVRRVDVAAALGAALFAVHPVQVEPVAWASGMYTLLSGVLSVAAIVAFVRHAETSKISGSKWAYAVATLLYVLALLAKASSVVVPLIAGLVDVLLVRKSWRKSLADLWPWLVLIVPTLLVARHFETGSHVVGTPGWVRPLVATDAVYLYAQKLVWPWNLMVDNGQTPIYAWQTGRLFYTWPLTVVLVVVAMLCWGRRPWVTVAIGTVLIAIAPFSGLAKSNFQIFSTVADRYLYLALPGVALGVACVITRSTTRRAGVLVTLVVVILAGRSYVQAGFWRDDETLFTYNQKQNPRSLISRLLLAILYDKQGDPARAEALYDQVLALEPNDPSINYNVGNFYLRQRRFADAAKHYQISTAADPRGELAFSNLGVALAQLGRYEEAITAFNRALEISPRTYVAQASMALAYELWGKPADAEKWYKSALEIKPDGVEALRGMERLTQTRSTTQPKP